MSNKAELLLASVWFSANGLSLKLLSGACQGPLLVVVTASSTVLRMWPMAVV